MNVLNLRDCGKKFPISIENGGDVSFEVKRPPLLGVRYGRRDDEGLALCILFDRVIPDPLVAAMQEDTRSEQQEGRPLAVAIRRTDDC